MVPVRGESTWLRWTRKRLESWETSLTHQNTDIAEQTLGGFVENVADLVLEVLRCDCGERLGYLASNTQIRQLPNGFNNADQFLPLYAAISPHAPATFEFKSKAFHR